MSRSLVHLIDAWLSYWDHAIKERHTGRCQLAETVIVVIWNNYPDHYFQVNDIVIKSGL